MILVLSVKATEILKAFVQVHDHSTQVLSRILPERLVVLIGF